MPTLATWISSTSSKRGRGLGGQHAGQPGREGGAHHDRHPALAGLGVEIEQALDVADRVGGRHDRLAAGHEPASQVGVGRRPVRPAPPLSASTGSAKGAGRSPRPRRASARSSRAGRWRSSRSTTCVDALGGHQLAGHPGPDGAHAEHGDPGHARGHGAEARADQGWSVVGQLPPAALLGRRARPMPRTRSTAAMAPAMPRATSARRNIFIGHLGSLEQDQVGARVRGDPAASMGESRGGASWNRTNDLILIRDAL